jgi:hypothetical protein
VAGFDAQFLLIFTTNSENVTANRGGSRSGITRAERIKREFI